MVHLGLVGVIAQITDPGINADFPGAAKVTTLLGNLKLLALYGSLASLFIGGGVWGLANSSGNGAGTTWGRRFAFGGAIGAIVTGLAVEVVNSFSALT